MADDRSHAIRFHLAPGSLHISSQTAEEGEARETVATEYDGERRDRLQRRTIFRISSTSSAMAQVAFEFKDGNSQAQLRPASDDGYDYKYVVMPMRI